MAGLSRKFKEVVMTRPKKDGSPLNIILDRETLVALKRYCDTTGATKTKAVEIAIKKFVESYFDPNKINT